MKVISFPDIYLKSSNVYVGKDFAIWIFYEVLFRFLNYEILNLKAGIY